MTPGFRFPGVSRCVKTNHRRHTGLVSSASATVPATGGLMGWCRWAASDETMATLPQGHQPWASGGISCCLGEPRRCFLSCPGLCSWISLSQAPTWLSSSSFSSSSASNLCFLFITGSAKFSTLKFILFFPDLNIEFITIFHYHTWWILKNTWMPSILEKIYLFIFLYIYIYFLHFQHGRLWKWRFNMQ